MDAILIQSPTSKLEATGSIPFSLTRGLLTDQPMTLDITSAGIDLAVLEAANTGLVNAAGLLVVDVHVTGTGSNPIASGSVRVQKGAFTVAATGAAYTNASIDATLQDQAVQITRLQIFDNNGDALQGTGRVQLENRAVRDIEFVVTGNDFTVLDNELRPRVGGCQPQSLRHDPGAQDRRAGAAALGAGSRSIRSSIVSARRRTSRWRSPTPTPSRPRPASCRCRSA